MNRAHNDVLEVWLEAGAGNCSYRDFAIWLVRRSMEIWRSAPARGASELDWSLVRAATIVPALVFVHSFFDYPLRTEAMMATIAFACALLVEPPIELQTADASESRLRQKGRDLATGPCQPPRQLFHCQASSLANRLRNPGGSSPPPGGTMGCGHRMARCLVEIVKLGQKLKQPRLASRSKLEACG